MKRHLLIVAIAGTLGLYGQQDPQYNLYQFNQLLINPAYAGARDGLSLAASRRQQWLDFPGAPVTTVFSIHAPLMHKSLGVGMTLIKDEMGPRDMIGGYANVAYILRLGGSWRLAFGVNAGYNRFQFRFDKLQLQTAETSPDVFANLTPGALDMNSGIFLRSKDFFFGASATHINAPDVFSYQATGGTGKYVYKLNTHLFITVGKSFLINDNLLFSPSILAKNVKNITSADLNLNFFLYKKLWLGAFYRSDYGPGALFQYYITNRFRIAYSYDTGLQDARRLGGSHEIMIGFDFAGTKSKMINPRFL
jgi:type IX secretion system PorP/SprF family membrane protein